MLCCVLFCFTYCVVLRCAVICFVLLVVLCCAVFCFALLAAPYLAIFEQGGSADIFSLITGGAEMTLLRA